MDKKLFILRNVPSLKEYLYHFNEFYKFITPSFYKKNDIVFLQESNADRIFLIYSGSIKLEKILELNFRKNYTDDATLNNLQAKLKKSMLLLKFEKGSILGNEALEKNQKYKYTAKADSEELILFCIKIKQSRFKYIYKAIKEYFEPVFLKNDKLIIDTIENMIENHLNTKIAYRGDDVKKCGVYRLNKKEEREFHHIVNEKIIQMRKSNLENFLLIGKNKSLEKLNFMDKRPVTSGKENKFSDIKIFKDSKFSPKYHSTHLNILNNPNITCTKQIYDKILNYDSDYFDLIPLSGINLTFFDSFESLQKYST